MRPLWTTPGPQSYLDRVRSPATASNCSAASARIAALTRWSRENPTAAAQRGQRGLVESFLARVDEEAAERGETLSDAERQRRAEVLRRLHMVRIAHLPRKPRRRRAPAGGGVA